MALGALLFDPRYRGTGGIGGGGGETARSFGGGSITPRMLPRGAMVWFAGGVVGALDNPGAGVDLFLPTASLAAGSVRRVDNFSFTLI